MSYDLGDYVDVKERLRLFYAKYPDGCLQFELLEVKDIAGKTVVIGRALAYRSPDDPRPGIGTAWELVPGSTPYTRGSELMNLETSCWGRAIGSLGIGLDRGIATMQEIQYARARQSKPVERLDAVPEDDPFYGTPPPEVPDHVRSQAVEDARAAMGYHHGPARTHANGDAPASPKQIGALQAMAKKAGHDNLDGFLFAESGTILGQITPREDLTKAQASVLFDALKAFLDQSPG